MSATPATSDKAPPLLGEHTIEVLRDVLGKSDGEIAALRAGGIV
jgi:crotonobetainyl-CoA:carnitine CoA-transferase CaiB-like acyl-CoA transferase